MRRSLFVFGPVLLIALAVSVLGFSGPAVDPGLPLCEDHDPAVYHGLLGDGCHYNHTHNADPHKLDNIFGPVGRYTGSELSYPWQTPHENINKHEGYKWDVHNIGKCDNHVRANSKQDTCIVAWRIEYHSMGGEMDATVRFHSFWIEAKVCTPNLKKCGIVRTGGWADFGHLDVPYKGTHVPLPSDPPYITDYHGSHMAPYRGHSQAGQVPTRSGIVPYNWLADAEYGYNQILTQFGLRSIDDWMGIDPKDPFSVNLICADFQCQYNHSTAQVYALWLDVPFENYVGWTDRMGNIVDGCTEAGLDCIPLIIEHAPVGRAMYSAIPANSVGKGGMQEYDFSPPGVHWIEYPN